ncbi:ABC transporter C family member [Dirofilaria immitis]
MTKDARKGDDKIGESKNDDDNDDDDALLLSQAMDNGDWIAPTQPDKSSFLSDNLRKGLLKQFVEIPFDGDVYMLTQEINRLRKHLGDSLGENQMLMYKVKNLNRENALLQDNLIQIHQTFEQKFLEQKSDFEKTERDMRNVITYQEQDLRTKEFRDRLNDSASIATGSNHAEVAEKMDDVRHNSPSVRLKKVSIPSFRQRSSFPRSLNDSPMLRKAFDHCKLVINDTFPAVDSQTKFVSNVSFLQHDNNGTQDNEIRRTSSWHEIQTLNPNLYNCLAYLRPDNRLFQFYGLCDEITKLDFHALSQELPRKHERKSTHIMRDILTESPKQWYR